jgi:hypothetical protein
MSFTERRKTKTEERDVKNATCLKYLVEGGNFNQDGFSEWAF